MNSEQIRKVWIDNYNRLCIQPQSVRFELIYRSAMGVYWNVEEHYLYPRLAGSWPPGDWFRQIISAVETECGYHLFITKNTEWENIDEFLKESIKSENDDTNNR